MVSKSRHAFKNYLVRKSYWVNNYECPICQKQSTQHNNFVAHKQIMCDGEKVSYKPKEIG